MKLCICAIIVIHKAFDYSGIYVGYCVMYTAFGAAYGTAKSGTGIAAMAVMRPELIMKCIIPVVMSGIIAIYGLVVAVLISSAITKTEYTLFQ